VRNPDAKWRLAAKDISELAAKQKRLSGNYSELSKAGREAGLYATCTDKQGGERGVVSAFLKENKNFSMISTTGTNPGLFGDSRQKNGFFRSLPHVHDMDGFFGAVIYAGHINQIADDRYVTFNSQAISFMLVADFPLCRQ